MCEFDAVFSVRFRVLNTVTVKIYLFWDMTPCPSDKNCRMPQILEENISSFFIVEEEVVRK